MGRTEVLECVRVMRFGDVFERCEEEGLSQAGAAELPGMSERTFRRWCRRFEGEGEVGLLDRRLGRPSPRQAPMDEARRRKRPRRPMVGMILHEDASTHRWLPGSAMLHDLVVTLDDASGAIYSAFLVAEEGTP